MKNVTELLVQVARDEQGADAVEYAGLVAVIAALFAAVAGPIAGHGAEIGDAISKVVKTWIASFA